MVVMPRKTQKMQNKATQDATFRQNGTGIFKRIKAYSKHKVRAVGTLVAATSLVWALNNVNAQDYVHASNTDSTKITAGMIPREGKLKVELKDGYVYFTNLAYPSGKKENIKIDVRDEMILFKNSKLVEERTVTLENGLTRYYAIYDDGVLTTTPKENNGSVKLGIKMPDGGKLLTYCWIPTGSFFGVGEDGIIAFATSDGLECEKLSKMWNTPISLKEPKLESGPDNTADLTDKKSLYDPDIGVYFRARFSFTKTEKFRYELIEDGKFTSTR